MIDYADKFAAIQMYTENIPISLNLACKMLRKGKAKVKRMIGNKIRTIEVDNNTAGLNLYDVINQIGKV